MCFCCCIIKAFHGSTELTAPSFNAASISAARRRGNYPANSSRAFNGPADCTPVERRVGALGVAAESGDSFLDRLCSETSSAMTLLPEQYRPPQQGGAQHSGRSSFTASWEVLSLCLSSAMLSYPSPVCAKSSGQSSCCSDLATQTEGQFIVNMKASAG